MDMTPDTIGLIGFGEAGRAFAQGWRQDVPGLALRAFDTKTDGADAAAMRAAFAANAVTGCDTLAAVSSPVIVSLVTADQAGAVARDMADVIRPDSLFFDGNSCAPDTKRASAAAIEAAGGRYVDMAIMAPVHPKLHRVPVLLSGPHAAAAQAICAGLGMDTRMLPGDVGRASSVKMLRSVMIKGLEALTLESLLAARKAGVEDEVVASLNATHDGWDWARRGAYNLERVTTHGQRRAAEMREVAQTVCDLGLHSDMSRAIAKWQDNVGALGLAPGEDEFTTRADAILAALEDKA